MSKWRNLGIVGALILLALPASAQDYRGRVQGKVMDSSQAVLPGVTVTLSNDATGVVVTRATDPAGGFVFDFIEPGTYTMVAELDGFKKAEEKGVRVSSARRSTKDFVLDVGRPAGDRDRPGRGDAGAAEQQHGADHHRPAWTLSAGRTDVALGRPPSSVGACTTSAMGVIGGVGNRSTIGG